MIIDVLEHKARYARLSPLLAKGLDAIHEYAGRPPGRYEIDGDRLFLMVQEYRTKEPADSLWEAHHEYIDVHCVLSGGERIGYAADAAAFETVSPYDSAKDAELFAGNGDLVTCAAGTFAVFFPHEPHMPGVAVDAPSDTRKVVVKVKWERYSKTMDLEMEFHT